MRQTLPLKRDIFRVHDTDEVRAVEDQERGVLAVVVLGELDALARDRGYRSVEDVYRDYFRSRHAA